MKITLNNRIKDLQEKSTVRQLLDKITPEKQKGIAVAVNNRVVPKDEWHNHVLKNNDDVLIINAVQGG